MKLFHILRYLLFRALGILITIFLGVFISVVIMNQSEFIDQAVYKKATQAATSYIMAHPAQFTYSNNQERNAIINEVAVDFADAGGVNLPYWQRQLLWTWNMLVFNWGDVEGVMVTDEGVFRTFTSQSGLLKMRYNASAIIGEHFPNTLLIVSVAYALVFMFGIPLALRLSRRYDSWIDRLSTALAPLSSIPSWVFGILLVGIFAIQLRWLPYNGKYDLFPPQDEWEYKIMIARHMALPVLSIFLSIFFQLVYTWRTYFMLYTKEDYVELAIAKGLSARTLELKYILRPSLPYIVTSFAFTLTGFWQMTTALEHFFTWPGIGYMYFRSLLMDDLLVSLGVVVIFAYVLGGIVLFLDLLYILLDPRIRFEITSKQNLQSRQYIAEKVSKKKRFNLSRFLPRISPADSWRQFKDWYQWSAKPFFQELRRYRGAMFSLGLISVLILLSVYALVAYPYSAVSEIWDPLRSEYKTRPELAYPVWYNWFLERDLPESKILDTRTNPELKSTVLNNGKKNITIIYNFSMPDGGFPKGSTVYFYPKYKDNPPFAQLTWLTPDGRALILKNRTLTSGTYYDLATGVPVSALDKRFKWESIRLKTSGEAIHKALFANPLAEMLEPLRGDYQLRMDILTFEPDSDVDAEFILYGQVYGWAGTDHLRRELSVGLLWGLPVALCIGLLGALTTSLLAMWLAATAAWVGGWVDAFIQRLTELNMILPILAVGVLLAEYYETSIWIILLIAILLNAFGSTTRGYRAAFLQVKESPYIEAARAYGASDFRIITKYLIPRIFPIMIPQVVMLIPGYVFLEATLAIFGVSTPYAPTWGRIIFDALDNGALRSHYFWLLEPVSLLLITSLAFAMLGFTLDRVLNPRLRTD